MHFKQFSLILTLCWLCIVVTGLALAQEPEPSGEVSSQALAGTAFSYQGQLNHNGAPVNGTCEFQFTLYSGSSGGTPVGATQTKSAAVGSGLFTVSNLDFGGEALNGEARWLAIAVRCPAGSGTYTELGRQPLTPAPYALALPGLRTQQNVTSPNIIGGYVGNTVTPGVNSAVIAGGGASGSNNRVTDTGGTVGGGRANQAGNNAGTTQDQIYSTVAGGYNNQASGSYAAVAGGYNNRAVNLYATIGGGHSNRAEGYAVVAGGFSNEANGNCGAIGGGRDNLASSNYATIGGGQNNNAGTGTHPTIAGGSSNFALANYASIGGGYSNKVYTNSGTIGGGWSNTVDGVYATIGGGYSNGAIFRASTVAGGSGNTARTEYATIGGGSGNTIDDLYYLDSNYATIGGGHNNYTQGEHATIGGGGYNEALAPGATIPGGMNNRAGGLYSFAAGYRAKADNAGCFVWADSTSEDVVCNVNDRFVAQASGGVYFYTNSSLTSGSYLAAGGGSWSSVSDRQLKENFTPVDGRDVAARLAEIPITTWNYQSQSPTIRHIGPMAQDFYAAFAVGESDRHITTVDADGVALSAIQGLYQLSQEQADRIETLEAENKALKQQLDSLEARLAALEEVSRAAEGGAP